MSKKGEHDKLEGNPSTYNYCCSAAAVYLGVDQCNRLIRKWSILVCHTSTLSKFHLAFEAGVTPLPLRHGLSCSVAAFRKHDDARLVLHTTRNLHRTIAFHHTSPLGVRHRRDRREAPSSWHARRRISPVAAYVP